MRMRIAGLSSWHDEGSCFCLSAALKCSRTLHCRSAHLGLWSHRFRFRRDFHTMEQSRQGIVRRPPLETARFEVGLTRAGQETAQACGDAGRMMLLILEHHI